MAPSPQCYMFVGPQWKPGQTKHRLVRAEFKATTGYGERLELPSAGIGADVRAAMSVLINRVETVLNELKAAGC
jgi:hypothetical protein